MILDKAKFSDFIANYPLYKNAIIEVEPTFTPKHLEGLGFTFSCSCQKDPVTVILRFSDKISMNLSNVFSSNSMLEFIENGEFLFVERLIGQCLLCKNDVFHLLLKLNSKLDDIGDQLGINFCKIGQYPSYSIKPDNYIQKTISSESLDFYKKALLNISASFGLGALAYFRRVFENEVRAILNEFLKGSSDEMVVKQDIEDAIKANKMDKFIESAYERAPLQLKEFGQNPLKLAYNIASKGIHSETDGVCLKNAADLKFLLDFIFKVIYDEKNTINPIKEIIKKHS
ncbi:hypothetical protein [Mongoliitalea lutea]|uniref:Uncharacterized protein n=1 Tax=Mongoliitalea lutea TaxID=849756 RepID=A0A8J3G6H6_9BACT|nr:hypothetical protein [Mongoliitalea lutea]GHB44425.1 hypothetical protein GCM10008106_26870 [Mongoliitalea lutea]